MSPGFQVTSPLGPLMTYLYSKAVPSLQTSSLNQMIIPKPGQQRLAMPPIKSAWIIYSSSSQSRAAVRCHLIHSLITFRPPQQNMPMRCSMRQAAKVFTLQTHDVLTRLEGQGLQSSHPLHSIALRDHCQPASCPASLMSQPQLPA